MCPPGSPQWGRFLSAEFRRLGTHQKTAVTTDQPRTNPGDRPVHHWTNRCRRTNPRNGAITAATREMMLRMRKASGNRDCEAARSRAIPKTTRMPDAEVETLLRLPGSLDQANKAAGTNQAKDSEQYDCDPKKRHNPRHSKPLMRTPCPLIVMQLSVLFS